MCRLYLELESGEDGVVSREQKIVIEYEGISGSIRTQRLAHPLTDDFQRRGMSRA